MIAADEYYSKQRLEPPGSRASWCRSCRSSLLFFCIYVYDTVWYMNIRISIRMYTSLSLCLSLPVCLSVCLSSSVSGSLARSGPPCFELHEEFLCVKQREAKVQSPSEHCGHAFGSTYHHAKESDVPGMLVTST